MCLYSICNVAYEHKVIVLNLFFLNQLAVQHYNWCSNFIEHEYSYKQCISLQHEKFINSPIASKNSIDFTLSVQPIVM